MNTSSSGIVQRVDRRAPGERPLAQGDLAAAEVLAEGGRLIGRAAEHRRREHERGAGGRAVEAPQALARIEHGRGVGRHLRIAPAGVDARERRRPRLARRAHELAGRALGGDRQIVVRGDLDRQARRCRA